MEQALEVRNRRSEGGFGSAIFCMLVILGLVIYLI